MEIADSVRADLVAAARAAAARPTVLTAASQSVRPCSTDRGEIFSGCNVENASYGLTICAERNAIFQAVAQGDGPLVIRAVVVFTPTSEPTAPCGACRQVINEFGPDAEVFSVCDGPSTITSRLSELLPDAFGPHNLGR